MRPPIYIALLILSASPAFAQDKPFVGPKREVTRIALPSDAQAIAAVDLKTLSAFDRLFTRYIWIREPDAMLVKNQSFTINTISCAPLIRKPVPVAAGNVLLMRIDFRWYTSKESELKKWLEVWEEYAFDPSFSLLITKDILDNLVKNAPDGLKIKRKRGGLDTAEGEPDWDDLRNWEEVDSGPYIQNGITVRKVLVKKKNPPIRKPAAKSKPNGIAVGDVFIEIPLKEIKIDDSVDVIRLDADHLDAKTNGELQTLTQSLAPVVEGNYFLFRALSTIQDNGVDAKVRDDGVFKVIYGGLYYEFAHIQTAKQAGAKDAKTTDIDILFAELGIGNAEKGDRAKDIFNRIQSDQRVGIIRSRVAGEQARQVEILPTLYGPLEGKSFVSITHDINDVHGVNINRDPIKNLLEFPDDAREVIWIRRNGLHGFALYNGQGVLQREVPFNIAPDTTVPGPFPKRLQAGISCMRCHASQSGWLDAPNNVLKLIGRERNGGKADVFGDLTNGNALLDDTNRRLAGLYRGEFDRIFTDARNDYARVILKTCGPTIGKDDPAQVNIARIVTESVGDQYNHYFYGAISPQEAVKQLGFRVPSSDAVEWVNKLLPPEKVEGAAFSPEDSNIRALRAGFSINRKSWDLILTQAISRSLRARAKQPELEKK